MALVAGDLIDEARDFHANFDDRHFPPKMLLRRLSAVERQFVREVTKVNEESLASLVTLTDTDLNTALNTNEGRHALNSILVIEATAKLRNSEQEAPVTIGTYEVRKRPESWPLIWVTPTSINLVDLRRVVGGSTHGWEEFENLKIRYVAEPALLANLGSTLTVPDIARDALVAMLVRFMAGRSGKEVRDDLAETLAEVSDLLASTIDMVAHQNMAGTRRVNVTWP